MIFTYGSSRSTPPFDKFTVASIAGTAAFQTRNFYIQYANRAGRSLLSDPRSVTGTGVAVTLEDGLILPEEEVFWIIVSYETTGDAADAGIVGMWQARDFNQTTRFTLPTVLYFTSEESLRINRAVASSSLLPSVSSLPNGAIALVLDSGKYYRSDRQAFNDSNGLRSYGTYPKALASKWVEWPGTFNSYIESTSDFLGNDVAIDLVPEALGIPPKEADNDSIAVRYWLNNGLSDDGGSPVVDGRYSLEIAVNGVEGYEGFFASNRIKYYLVGYINRATGVLNNSIDTAGELRYWNPGAGVIVLPEDLPRNHAAVYDIILSFDNSEAIGVLPSGTPDISLNFTQVFSIQGNLNESANLIGDLVYQDRDKLLVVPGAFRLAGLASIKIDNAAQGYLIDAKDKQYLANLLPDTADQIVAMSGALNGYCTVRQSGDSLEYGEVVRAIVSTSPGIASVVADSPLVLTGEGISVTVEHPISDGIYGRVRSDYPDRLIANNTKALFTPTVGYVYLELNGIIYRSNPETITAVNYQTFNYQSLGDFTQVAVLPNPPFEFSLFQAEGIVAAPYTGNISGTVTVYFAYAYETPNYKATTINHQAVNGISTASLKISQIISDLSNLVAHLDDYSNPHQVSRGQIGAASQTDFANHLADNSNPHQVTPGQIGAASQTDFTSHRNSTSNPHQVTPGQIGAVTQTDFTSHLNSTSNPHGITPAQIGAVALADARIEILKFHTTAIFTVIIDSVYINHYLIDAEFVAITANLPTSPPNLGIVRFCDRRYNFAAKNLTINPGSGKTINGQASLVLATNGQSVTLIYDDQHSNYIAIF